MTITVIKIKLYLADILLRRITNKSLRDQVRKKRKKDLKKDKISEQDNDRKKMK